MRKTMILLLLVLCIGCESSASLDNGSPDSSSASYAREPIFDATLGKYDPPVQLTTVGSVNSDVRFINGETLDNNVHTRWALDRLGIRIAYKWVITDTNNAYANKLRLELAKGTLPDIVTTRDRYVIQELIDSGQFMEVGELFDEYASDIWKAAMREDPSAWDYVTRDGHKYAIPILDYEYISDPILWIRQDWLDKLRLDPPSTMEDLERVMDAFANLDPDGNGRKDTFGLSVGFVNGFNTWMADSSWIFGAFGAIPNQWNRAPDGTLAYGSVSPGIKDGLGLLKRWIEKGYISGESLWYDEVRAARLFTSGKAGIIAGPYWMSGWPLSNLLHNVPDAKYKAIRIPTGPEGSAQRRGSLPVNGAILINKKMSHPEVFFTYQNYLYDHFAVSKGEFEHGLAYGYDWTIKNGKPSIEPADLPQGNVRVASYTLTFDGARVPSRVIQEIPLNEASVLFSQIDASKKEQFTGPSTLTMKTRGELLRKLEQKTFENILFGEASIDEFEPFVSKWMAYGGDRITREVNEWDRTIERKPGL